MDGFKKRYDESVLERRNLENRKELMKIRMVRASELTSALDVEKVNSNLLIFFELNKYFLFF